MDVAQELVQMNQVYRERFPRATANMEARLEELHARLLDAISPSTVGVNVNANANAPSSSASTFSGTGAESGAPVAVAVAVGAGAEAAVGGAAGAMGTTGSDGPAREPSRAERRGSRGECRAERRGSRGECVSLESQREASLESQLIEEAVKPAVDAVAHFMLQQLANYVSECLRHSRDHQLSSQYFIGLNEDISALINKAHVCPLPLPPPKCHSAKSVAFRVAKFIK